VSGQLHAPAALPPGKRPRYPFYRRLGGPQSRSGRYGEVKIFYPTGTRTPASPCRPAPSQPLYRLSYPGTHERKWTSQNLSYYPDMCVSQPSVEPLTSHIQFTRIPLEPHSSVQKLLFINLNAQSSRRILSLQSSSHTHICFVYPLPSYRTLTVSKFFIFLWIYTQLVGLLGRVIGPSQDLYLSTGQHKYRINARAHTHTPNMHALSGIRTQHHSVRASETVHVFDRSATVTGFYFFKVHFNIILPP
jgi:hypothetical protein